MKTWKRRMAAALCICMLANMASPAYGQVPDPSERGHGLTTATDSDIGKEGPEDSIVSGKGEATGSDWEEELENDLENDLASDSDADLEEELATTSNLIPLGDEVPLESLEIVNANNGKNWYMEPGETFKLEVKALPENATDTWIFESSDKEIATVDESGLITAKKVNSGDITIKVKAAGGDYCQDYIRLRVVEDAVKVTFHGNGGTFSNGQDTRMLSTEITLGMRPEIPEKEEEIFNGSWYSDQECQNPVVENNDYFYPKTDMDLYAGWSAYYEIRFDYNGVTHNGETEKVVQIPQGQEIGYSNRPSFPDNPEQTGNKLLLGWKTSDGTLIKKDKISSYVPDSSETLKAVWSDYYTICFDYNGGKSYGGNKTEEIKYVVPGESVSYSPYNPQPPAEDQTLLGWLTEGGELLSENEVSTYIPQRSETLKAIWSRYYTITFDPNGGSFSGNSGNPVKVAEGEAVRISKSPVRTGYTLTGWKVQGKEELVQQYQDFTPESDVTLVAQWAQYWTITYDANGGTCSNDRYKSVQVERGASEYLSSGSTFKKDGYELEGWCLDQKCQGPVLTGYYTPESDVTLYAKWASSVTITLNAAGGAFKDGADTYTVKKTLGKALGTNSLEKPTREGFLFEGWYLDAEYQNRVKSSYVVTGNADFYAKWSQNQGNTYTVRIHAGGPWYYDRNSGEYVEEAEFQIARGSKIGSVSDPSRPGYEAEWYLDQDYKTPYDSSYVPKRDVDLYARYQKTVTVSWDADGGHDRSGNLRGKRDIGQGSRFNFPDVYKENMVFAGWFTADGKPIDPNEAIYESVFVKARWEHGYKVTLDLQGGELEADDAKEYLPAFSVKAGETIGNRLIPRKEGAAFAGWSADGQVYDTLSSVKITKDTVFQARWDQTGHKVTLHGTEGMIRDGYSDERYSYVDELTVYVPEGPGRGKVMIPSSVSYDTSHSGGIGKTFLGWSLTKGGEILNLNTHNFTEDTELYAVWSDAAVKVFFVMNGGFNQNSSSNNISVSSLAPGEPLTYPRDSDMFRPGFTFGGWYKNKDLTGEAIRIPDSKYSPSESEYLYAKWTPENAKTYAVTFDSQGGSQVTSQNVFLGEAAKEPEAPLKAGSIFIGWFLDQEGIRKYDFGSPVYKDIILYAKWMETVDLKDSAVTVNGSYTYTGEVIIPDLTVKMGTQILQKDIHYTVSGDSVNAGTGSVTITAVPESGYTGGKTVSFTIEKADMNQQVPTGPFAATYGQELSVISLAQWPGWKWKNPNNKVGNAGIQKHQMVYTSTDLNYKDQIAEVEVTVAPKSLSGAMIKIQGPSSFAYTGSPIEPVFTVSSDGNNVTAKDYTVVFENNINAGTATIRLTGKGNYTGEVSKNFEIKKGDPSLIIGNQVYETEYGRTLKSITLPRGFSWQNPDGKIDYSSGTKTFKADFTAWEGCNYEDKQGMDLKVKSSQRSIQSTARAFVEKDKQYWIYEGKPVEPEIQVTDTLFGEPKARTLTKDTDYSVSYENNDKVGTATVRISGKGHYAGTAVLSFQIIRDPHYIGDAVVSLNPKEATYTGEAIEPETTVVLAGKTLNRGTDYTVSYTDNTEPGLGTVTVKGTGTQGTDTYYGEKTVTFFILPAEYELEAVYADQLWEVEIPKGFSWQQPEAFVGDVTGETEPGRKFLADFKQLDAEKKDVPFLVKVREKDINDSTVTVTLAGDSVYDPENPAEPEVIVQDTKLKQVLVEGRDYQVVYKDNLSAGTGTIVIQGIGNYTGERTGTFTINQADSDLEVNSDHLTENKKMELTIKDEPFFLYAAYEGDGEITFTSSNDHIFQVEKTRNDFGDENDGKITVTGIGSAVLTIEVSETKNYQGAKLVYEVIVSPVTIGDSDIRLAQETFVYTGKPIQPEFTVEVNGETLEKDQDYTVTYGENTKAGQGSVSVNGKGDYTGAATALFAIEKAEMDADAPQPVKAVYGQKLGEIVLPRTEYGTWMFRTPEAAVGDAGQHTYEAVLAETENYKEKTAQVVVNVEPKALTEDMVVLEYTKAVYNGTALKPAVTLKDQNQVIGKENYAAVYVNNIHAGTAAVIVTGKNNYQGEIRKTFQIQKAEPVIRLGAGTVIEKKLREGSFSLDAAITNGGKLDYQSSDPSVASVDENGLVTLLKVGKTVLTVSYDGSQDYEAAEVRAELTVRKNSSGGSGGGSGSSSGGGSGSSLSGNGAAGVTYDSVPGGYTGATKLIHQNRVPVYVEEGSWRQNEAGSWTFMVDGQAAAGRWAAAYNPYADRSRGQQAFDWFLFDSQGIMKTGWYQDEKGDLYYLNPVSDNTRGRMVTGWMEINGVFYYFNEKADGKRGALLRNTVTPDGWQVDENGVRKEKAR